MLQEKNVKEKRFSVGFFDADYLSRFISESSEGGEDSGFQTFYREPGRRSCPSTSCGTFPEVPTSHDYLFELMLWGHKE
jgi:hypothetical protein